MRTAIFLAILLLSSVTLADITMTYPRSIVASATDHFDNQTYVQVLVAERLGKISPGQLLVINFSRTSGSDYNWDDLAIGEPWGHSTVTDYADSFTAKIPIPANASGDYTLSFSLSNSFGFRTSQRLPLVVEVTEAAYTFGLNSTYSVTAGQTNLLQIPVISESVAEDSIDLTISGLPKNWTTHYVKYMKPFDIGQFDITMRPVEEGAYTLTFLVKMDSGAIQQLNRTLRVMPTIQSKFESTADGFSLIPAILQPFYSLISFIGSLF